MPIAYSDRKVSEDFKVLIDDAEIFKATASQTGERIGEPRQRLEKNRHGRKTLAEKTWFQKVHDAKASTESRLGENTWAGWVIASGTRQRSSAEDHSAKRTSELSTKRSDEIA